VYVCVFMLAIREENSKSNSDFFFSLLRQGAFALPQQFLHQHRHNETQIHQR